MQDSHKSLALHLHVPLALQATLLLVLGALGA